MHFGFLHAALAILVVEEIEDLVERLLRVVQHVGKRPALPVLPKVLAADGYFFGDMATLELQKMKLQISHL
jgi:hypothetical protein